MTTPTATLTNCAICETATDDTGISPALCPTCRAKADAYNERVNARHARLTAAAAKVRAESESTLSHARAMADVIPFGQPILVGHYSEGRDRRYRAKIDRGFRKGYELYQRAKDLERRADSAADNDAIRSDDPLALVKLEAKLIDLQALRVKYREINRQMRGVLKLPEGDRVAALTAILGNEHTAIQLLKPDYMGRVGIPGYKLSNLGGQMRQVEDRIATLRIARARAESGENEERTIGDCRIVCDPDDNRIRLYFPGKPAAATIADLKSRGFRWSPRESAWQRQLTGNARFAALQVAQNAARNK